MRKEFAELLYKAMQEDQSIWLLTGDLGFGLFDKIRQDFPERFLNVGAAEQTLLDVGVGLALAGKKPICYSITPFLLYRGFETIRTYISWENIPVILAGSGRDRGYLHDGISHWCEDAKPILDTLPNIKQYWPLTTEEIPVILTQVLESKSPSFISLIR